MNDATGVFNRKSNRRKFLKNGMLAAGAATVGAGLLPGKLSAFGRDNDEQDDRAPITKGDIAILTFLSALEQIEEDLWLQYSELGGTQDNEVSGLNGGNSLYTAALKILDGDMAQYIHDNTDDEISHHRFLNNYFVSKGAKKVDLSKFATLPSSKADGARQIGRLTNLTQLTVDTSFWSRYRSITNPDFDPNAPFAQAVPSLNVKQHTAIPRSNADTKGSTISSDNTSKHHHSPPGHRLHRRIPFCIHRTRWQQPVSHARAESDKPRGLANLAQHRPERDHALPNLAGQSRQRSSDFRHGQRTGRHGRNRNVLHSVCSPGRDESRVPQRRYVTGQSDHARANALHRPELGPCPSFARHPQSSAAPLPLFRVSWMTGSSSASRSSFSTSSSIWLTKRTKPRASSRPNKPRTQPRASQDIGTPFLFPQQCSCATARGDRK